MSAVKWIAIWGMVAILSSVAAAIVAGSKRRDHSAWAAWTFLFPPLLIVLLLMPAHAGPPLPRRSLDDEDHSF